MRNDRFRVEFDKWLVAEEPFFLLLRSGIPAYRAAGFEECARKGNDSVGAGESTEELAAGDSLAGLRY